MAFTAEQLEVLMVRAEGVMSGDTMSPYHIMQVAHRAQENAGETVYIEKTVPEDQYHVILLSTLREILDACEDEDTIAWYAERGVTA